MRICLFTDTLGDINGVSRFIRTIADQATLLGQELHIITSTRLSCPARANIHNIAPRYARAMPGYPQLELAWPRGGEMVRLVESLRPDVIHVSTPGPIGSLGRRFARRSGLPLVGTYHTDFPAYIDHLFGDRAMTWLTARAMRRFYQPFDRLFTRSAEYAANMHRLGIHPERIVRLLPGIDTDSFHSRFRDESIWRNMPDVPGNRVKVLYVGRVSVEKNLPLLTTAWKIAAAAEPSLHLIVVGDGPYRHTMQAELTGLRATFLGFRHGAELSTLYASSDLFAFPSATDTLGQVVMEAQSSGLAVIVSDQGGPSEVVNHAPGANQSGIVLPTDDAKRWADEIIRLARDPETRARFGRAAHENIQPMSIRHSFEHFWNIHEDTLHAHTMPS